MHRLWQQCWLSRRVCIGPLLAGFLIGTFPDAAHAQRSGLRIPVPRQTIYPGQRIQPSMLSWRLWRGKGNLTGIAQGSHELVGKVARSTLLPNRIVYIAALREPYAVDKGQIVGLYFKFGGIEIRSKGIAQQAGAIGAFVRVQNVDSGRLISGIVQNDGSVRVGSDQ